jgi:hypothetical protein
MDPATFWIFATISAGTISLLLPLGTAALAREPFLIAFDLTAFGYRMDDRSVDMSSAS